MKREKLRKPKEKGYREGKKVGKERRKHKMRLNGVKECQKLIKISFYVVKGISTAGRTASFLTKKIGK